MACSICCAANVMKMRWMIFFLTLPILAHTADLAALANRELPDLLKLYKTLHQNPELSLQEVETSARMAGELRDAGYEVTTGVGGHGIVGVLKNGDGPVVLLRTDLDALPVKEQTGADYASTKMVKDDLGKEVPVMHACGHDIHMTCFVGAARLLAGLKAGWKGTLVLIGQPAEERVLGARFMLRDRLFSRFPTPQRAIALHCTGDLPHGSVGVTEGYTLANVDTVDIIVKGVGGHGSAPHLTKDPVVLAAQLVLAFQTVVSREIKPGDPAVLTVGSIHGGTKHNIIGDEVRLQLTLRSYSDKARQQLLDSVKRITRHTALAAGLPEDKLPEVQVSDESAPALYNDPSLMAEMQRVFEELLGRQNVIVKEPIMGAEDFAEYGRTPEKVPLCMFWLGTTEPEALSAAKRAGTAPPSLHSPLFKPVPEPSIRTGVQALTAAVLHALKAP